MATTLIPPVGTPTPPESPTEGLRFLTVRANLMPDDVISGRQALAVRKHVLLGLACLIVLIVAGYGFSWLQTTASTRDLDAAQREGVGYQTQQKTFSSLVQSQADVQGIQSQLQTLMSGDLPWKSMLSTLRSKAPSGVALTSITATVTVPSAAIGAGGAGGAVAPTLTQGGKATVGQVTLSGTAPDKRSVAAYADRLASAKGLAAPLVSSIGAGSGDVTWSMTVAITSDAMGGRYSAPSATNATGGN